MAQEIEGVEEPEVEKDLRELYDSALERKAKTVKLEDIEAILDKWDLKCTACGFSKMYCWYSGKSPCEKASKRHDGG